MYVSMDKDLRNLILIEAHSSLCAMLGLKKDEDDFVARNFVC